MVKQSRVTIDNDKEALSIYNKKLKDAIQKQSPSAVPVQSETGISETVEEGKPKTEPQVVAEKTKEEVAQAQEDLVSSKTRLDEITESISQRIDYTEEDLANFDTLEEDKANGVITALAEKVAEGATLSDIENNVYNANKKQVDEVSNLVAERTAIEQEVSDLESILQASNRKVEFRAEEKINPIDFSTQLEERYGVQLDLTGNLDKGDITLSRIVVPEDKRNTGVGTKVMEEIIKYADANGLKITLTPSTDFGGQSVKRLTDFYKKFGFVENKGDNKDFKIKDAMYRSPEIKAKSESIISDLEKEGVGVKLTGEEDVVAGENNPTVKTINGYQEDYSAEDIFSESHAPNSRVVTTASNIASGKISYKKDGEDVIFNLPYLNIALAKKIESLRKQYKSITGSGKAAKEEKEKIKKEINKVAKKILSEFTDVMSQNLLALYDTLTPEFVKDSKQWYVGANRMANAIANKYNMTVEQVGGIIAALSPQNDWFNNVSVAERTIEIMSKYADTKLTKDIVDRAVKYNSDKSGTPNAFAEILIDLFNKIGEVSINEAQNKNDGTFIQATILRAFDQAINSPKVAITNPTGAFVGFDTTPVRWNSTSEISKAINIFRNGDVKNVNENLGNGNKVRNFYNNIVDPNSSTPYVTADTHALSAALNSPISANDASGFGLFNGSLEPTYALVKEAYIRAAQVAGILPREMQSITWEAQRIGINDKNRTEVKKQELFNYISESRKNKETAYERATELIARNRSADPTWGKSNGIRTQKSIEDIRREVRLRAEQRISDLSSLRGTTQRGMGDTTPKLGRGTAGRASLSEGVGTKGTVQNGLTQQQFTDALAEGNLSNATKLANFLNKVFPSVTISTDKVSFDTIMSQVGTEMYMRGNQIVYGVTVDGDVYINPDVHNSESDLFNTTVHEFGHVWTDYLQTSEKGRQLYQRGTQLVEDGIANDENVKKIFDAQMKKYPDNRARAINETMAILIGNKGEVIVNQSVKSNFKNWLLDVFKFIKEKFKMSKDLTAEDVQNLTLDGFIETALADIFSGEEISLTEAQKKSLKNPDAMFSSTQSMQSIIQQARANGFSDAAIKQVLLNRGFRANDIKNALIVNIDVDTNLPREFANIQGGIAKGYQLFTDIRAQLQRFAHSGPRGGIRKEQTKTWSEIREKAIELLKAHPIYQAQSDDIQVNTNTPLPPAFANIKDGLQLFTDVLTELKRFSNLNARGVVGRTRTKTAEEIRAKAISLLKAHRVYKTQSNTVQMGLISAFDRALDARPSTVQMELISAFDRTLNTSANTNVTRQIAAIRNNLRQRRIGAKELQQAKIAVKNLIRSVLPKSDTYSQVQINKLISIISNATEDTILADTEKVMAIVQQQRAKMKTSVIENMMKLVIKKAKVSIGKSGKRRGRGLDARGQQFFKNIKSILEAVVKNDTEFMTKLANELLDADSKGLIEEAIQKELLGEQLTQDEIKLIDKAYAFDTFGDLMTMELEDVQQLYNELQTARAESIMRLRTRREVRNLKYKAINKQATDQIAELYPELFISEVKDVALSNDKIAQLNVGENVLIQDTSSPNQPKIKAVVKFKDPNGLYVDITDGSQIYRIVLNGGQNKFKVLKTETVVREKTNGELTQDRAAIRLAFQKLQIWSGFKKLAARWNFTTITGMKDFMRNRILHIGSLMNLFDNDAKGLTFFRDNIYRPLNRMDEKSKVGYFLEMTNLDAMANSIPGITKGYKQIRNMLQTGIHEFVINGGKEIYNADKLLRIYALSLNDDQNKKLKAMGWNDAQIQKIKDIVGPQAIEFTNKLVDYFSNDYYESVNKVYSNVNDVNLGYISNYFPTITQAKKVNKDMLDNGDFSGIFNAETAPALKERTDKTGVIELNYDFTDVVESHFVTMEKYKAYAEGVKDMNAIFNNDAFNVLLEESGLQQVVRRSVNFAITPNAGQKEKQTALGKMMTKFTGYALSFKAIQILKQATSFINAYEDYRYFSKDSRIPKAIQAPIDMMMFMVDSAKVIATLPKQVRKAYGMSANVRDRMLKGIEGDVYGLETGSSVFTPINKRTDIWARAVRAFKTGAAGPTVLGDILGVMGYMVNYNRNIANGMTEAQALEAFNNYNATAQSRRGTEKSPIQQNSSEMARAFTMFGSTTFLQINKVLTAQTNIFRAIKERKMPSSKDIRAFAINLGVANALFVGTSNLAKYIKGDDEDREEVIRQMKRAMLGLNLIESIPLVGTAVESALSYIEGEEGRRGDGVVNPYMQIYRKIQKATEEDTTWGMVQPVIEITIGAQLDPFIGLYNGFAEGFDEEAMYDILGISKSYRPTQEKEGSDTPQNKPMTKEDMKRYYPEMYEQLYGPYSNSLESDPAYEAYRKEIDAELQRAKDAAHGYVPKEK